MGQIHAHQLGSGCKGVVLVNIAEAIPYFGLSKPVSQFGVALLILDHHDPRLPSNCPITKVPAKCVATGEPLIVSAAVLQIGQQEVVRNTPSQCLEVPEVSNSVVRVQVYKDQSTADWDEFIQKPVKHLLSLKPFSEVASGDILDVWDRQYMTMRLTRVPVQEAQLFMVNIRVEATALPPSCKPMAKKVGTLKFVPAMDVTQMKNTRPFGCQVRLLRKHSCSKEPQPLPLAWCAKETGTACAQTNPKLKNCTRSTDQTWSTFQVKS